MTDTKEIRGVLDPEGRLTQLPARRKKKLIALSYIADLIPAGEIYTEREFSDMLCTLHTFGDPATLRRELYDCWLINRDSNGSNYCVNPGRPTAEELIEKYSK